MGPDLTEPRLPVVSCYHGESDGHGRVIVCPCMPLLTFTSETVTVHHRKEIKSR